MICPVCQKGIASHQRTGVLGRPPKRVHLPCLDRHEENEKAKAKAAEIDRRSAIDRLLDRAETF
jgi:hypothetical protein